ncbi:MAG: hypothetical protein INR71_08275, partial [Terriglobus roseus]|nr:hypothetical protein [Terriglobus roseus]
QTQQQPAYGNPQPQRQPSFAPATQPNFVPPQPPTANQHAATNMYNQQMRWPPYPYANMQQPQQYQNMSTRMR